MAGTRGWKRTALGPLEKYVVNPQMRFGLRRGLVPNAFALLETTGRRTGKKRQTPVGNGADGDRFWLIAEHGRRADYVQNLVSEPRVRVKIGPTWRDGTAHLLPDDDGLARRRQIDATHGFNGTVDGAIFRLSATDPLTIRIDLDEDPSA